MVEPAVFTYMRVLRVSTMESLENDHTYIFLSLMQVGVTNNLHVQRPWALLTIPVNMFL